MNQSGTFPPIMIMKPSLLAILKERNKQDVKLFGKYLDRADGRLFIADDIVLGGGDTGTPMKRKRGGL